MVNYTYYFLLGNAALIGVSPSKLYKNKMVCEKNFKETDVLPSGRLLKTAVPIPYENASTDKDVAINRVIGQSPKRYRPNTDNVHYCVTRCQHIICKFLC